MANEAGNTSAESAYVSNEEIRIRKRLNKLLAEEEEVQSSKTRGHTHEDYLASRHAIVQDDGTCCRPSCSKGVWIGANGKRSAFCSKDHANSYELGFKEGSDPRTIKSDEDPDSEFSILKGHLNCAIDLKDLAEIHEEIVEAVASGTISDSQIDTIQAVYKTRLSELEGAKDVVYERIKSGGQTNGEPLTYECEFDCGEMGNFEFVSAHEKICRNNPKNFVKFRELRRLHSTDSRLRIEISSSEPESFGTIAALKKQRELIKQAKTKQNDHNNTSSKGIVNPMHNSTSSRGWSWDDEEWQTSTPEVEYCLSSGLYPAKTVLMPRSRKDPKSLSEGVIYPGAESIDEVNGEEIYDSLINSNEDSNTSDYEYAKLPLHQHQQSGDRVTYDNQLPESMRAPRDYRNNPVTNDYRMAGTTIPNAALVKYGSYSIPCDAYDQIQDSASISEPIYEEITDSDKECLAAIEIAKKKLEQGKITDKEFQKIRDKNLYMSEVLRSDS